MRCAVGGRGRVEFSSAIMTVSGGLLVAEYVWLTDQRETIKTARPMMSASVKLDESSSSANVPLVSPGAGTRSDA